MEGKIWNRHTINNIIILSFLSTRKTNVIHLSDDCDLSRKRKYILPPLCFTIIDGHVQLFGNVL